MSLSLTIQDYKKVSKEGDIYGDDIRLNNDIDNENLLSNKKRLNEKYFK